MRCAVCQGVNVDVPGIGVKLINVAGTREPLYYCNACARRTLEDLAVALGLRVVTAREVAHDVATAISMVGETFARERANNIAQGLAATLVLP